MLTELQVRNFGLIESLSIQFDEGLNVLSGDTGVGKSLIISALKFLLGARAKHDVIREGAEEAVVTGVFCSAWLENGAVLDELAHLSSEDAGILLRRSVSRKGRSRCSINDDLVTLSELRRVANRLVDIHGQHEELSLLGQACQRDLLDRFGGHYEERDKYADAFKSWRTVKERSERFKREQEAMESELALLQHQVEEIRAAAPQPGEIDELRSRQEMLRNLEQILQCAGAAQAEIYEDDYSIVTRLGAHLRSLERYRELHDDLATTCDGLEEAVSILSEAAASLGRFCLEQEYDAREVERIEEHLDLLSDLVMKYGRTEADIIAHAEQAETRIEALLRETKDGRRLDAEAQRCRDEVSRLSRLLHDKRVVASKRLSRSIVRELRDLGMPKARFEIEVCPRDNMENADESGADIVEFRFSANPGEILRPLAQVASGGETSRIMLAVKRVLAAVDTVPVLVFDEVDANIGGRMGKRVGQKLAELARDHQVICVTHLPQIASFASHHVKVYKKTVAGRTVTLADTLGQAERIHEIAEMIRGTNVTSTSLKQAREMLEEASSIAAPTP